MKIKFKNKIVIAAAILLAAVIVFTLILIVVLNNKPKFNVSKTDDGSIEIKTTINDLKSNNIDYGDSIEISFSTGYISDDVALSNKEILNSGQHIAIANDSNSNIVFKIQNMQDTWGIANLDDNSKAYIKLTKKEKYLNLHKALNMQVVGDIKDLRSLRGGNLGLLDIFRGPNLYTNEETTAALKNFLYKLNLKKEIYLDENDKNIHNINIKDKDSNSITLAYLLQITKDDQHCFIYSDDPDFTAYFCALIEAIAGCSYDEIINDYMKTYENFYGITKETFPDEYDAIKTFHIDWFLQKLCKTPNNYDLSKCDFTHESEMYLRACGVSDDDIALIKNRFNKS